MTSPSEPDEGAGSDDMIDLIGIRGEMDNAISEGESNGGRSVTWTGAWRADDAAFRRLVMALPAAVYTIDGEGRIDLFNELAAEMWGRRPIPREEFWCGSWRLFFPDGTPMAHAECPLATSLKQGRPVRGQEVVFERPDGSRHSVLPHPELLIDESGEIVGGLNLIVDITDRKLAEAEVQDLNRRLEARVAERTAQLETCCYSIAHDLRQHIRGISINAHLVNELLPDASPELQSRLDRLVVSAKRMDTLVRALLEYGNSARGDLSVETLDVSSLAEEAATQLSETYPTTQFLIQPGLIARGNKSSIGVVLLNLLENACKYVSPARASSVEVGQANGEFFVRDNGIGFDMAYAPKLFQPFARLHRAEEYPGAGIGLASVRQIVERHGGTVRAESTVGDGAIFYFSLP